VRRIRERRRIHAQRARHLALPSSSGPWHRRTLSALPAAKSGSSELREAGE
jgi:hypothetical protein